MARRIVIRFLLVILSAVFALGAVEAAFRIAGSIAGGRRAEALRDSDPSGRPIVVFCGDSHMYGVYFEKEQSLPAAVERASRLGGSKGIRCINLGLPGATSWDCLQQVREALSVKPAAVIVRFGINNAATLPPDEGFGSLENLKIVKLARRTLLNYRLKSQAHTASFQRIGVEGGESTAFIRTDDAHVGVVAKNREGLEFAAEYKVKKDPNFGGFEPRLKADCLTMIRECKESATPIFFMSYSVSAEFPFSNIMNIEREVTNEAGVPFVECAPTLDRWMAESAPAAGGAEAVVLQQNRRAMYLVADGHPAPTGYQQEASILIKTLVEARLADKKCIQESQGQPSAEDFKIPRAQALDGAPGSYQIEGAPGDAVYLFLGGAGISDWNKIKIPVDTKEFDLLRSEFSVAEIKGKLDERGKVTLSAPAAFLQKMTPPIFVTCVAERGSAGATRRFLSVPVPVPVPKPR